MQGTKSAVFEKRSKKNVPGSGSIDSISNAAARIEPLIPALGTLVPCVAGLQLSPGCRPVDRRQPCRPFVNRCQPLSTCRPVDLSTVVNHLSTTCQPVNRDPMLRRCRPCRPVDLSTCRPLSTVVNRCQPLSTSVNCVGCDILHLKAMLNQCQLRWEGKECHLLTCQPVVNRCQPLSTVVNQC